MNNVLWETAAGRKRMGWDQERRVEPSGVGFAEAGVEDGEAGAAGVGVVVAEDHVIAAWDVEAGHDEEVPAVGDEGAVNEGVPREAALIEGGVEGLLAHGLRAVALDDLGNGHLEGHGEAGVDAGELRGLGLEGEGKHGDVNGFA